MSDLTLQEAERRAHLDVATRAALLRARLRHGQLAFERIELAAYSGDEASRLVVDPEHRVGYFNLPPTRARPHGTHGDGITLWEFICELERWGTATVVRACIAGQRWGIRHLVELYWSRRDTWGGEVRARVLLAAAQAWLDEPNPITKHRCRWESGRPGVNPAGFALAAMLAAHAPGFHVGWPGWVQSEVEAWSPQQENIRLAIRAELITWALGGA